MNERLEKARLKIMMREPFVGALVASLPLQAGYHTRTNGREITVGFDLLEKLSDKELRFVIAHEVMHVLLGHCWRSVRLPVDDPLHRRAWTLAEEVKVNGTIMACGNYGSLYEAMTDPDTMGVYPQHFGLSPQQVVDMTEEDIYQHILRMGDHKPQQGEDGPITGEAVRELTLEEEQQARQAVEAAVQSALAMSRAGDQALGASFIAHTVQGERLHWRQILAEWLSSRTGGERSWSRRSRRSAEIILPARRTERADALLVVIDTSASCLELAPEFMTHLLDLVATLPVDRLGVWAHDVDVFPLVETDDPHEVDPDLDLKGGGGTKYLPVVAKIAEGQWDIVVWLTDLEPFDSFPRQVDTNHLLWVVPAGFEKRVPCGTVVTYRR